MFHNFCRKYTQIHSFFCMKQYQHKDHVIAVVGVSHQQDKYGYKIFHDLVDAGYSVYGVNPKGGTLLSKPLYASLWELPVVPMLVLTVVPPEVTRQVVEQCHKLKVKNIWMQPGSESPEAIQQAEAYGIKVVHTTCFMRVKGIWNALSL